MARSTKKQGFTALLIALWGAGMIAGGACAQATQPVKPHADVMSLGGAVTEIVYALGEGDRLIARDSTSSYPPEVNDLPSVGYVRALSPEGVLSLDPGLILAEQYAGPEEAVDVLKATAIPYVEVPEGYDGAAIATKVRVIGGALGVEDKAGALAGTIEADMAAMADRIEAIPVEERKSVMFVFSTQGGRILASGSNTPADSIIRLAGGVNALTGFEGFKHVSDEAVSVAAPDVILMMDRGGEHAVTNDVLFNLPAIAVTPAAEREAIIRMNGLYLLGFGPRTAEAIADLSAQLYGR